MIKKFLITILITFIILSSCLTGSYAGESDSKSFSLNWYLFGTLFSYYSFDAGYVLSPYLTLNAEFQYFDYISLVKKFFFLDKKLMEEAKNWDVYAMKFGPGLRFYPMGNAPDGFFLGAYFNYHTFSAEYIPLNVTAKANAFSGTLWFGFQCIFSVISFELATGLRFYSSISDLKVEYTGGEETYDIKKTASVWSGLAIGLGIAF